MAKMIMVTGGARSGKSAFAEQMANRIGSEVLYIATAVPFDEEMKDRIKHHQQGRPKKWETYEGYKNLDKVLIDKGQTFQCIIMECLSVWLTNHMLDFSNEADYDTMRQETIDCFETQIKNDLNKIIDAVSKTQATMIFVTNEIGLGLVPEGRLSRIFRDIQGRMNQLIANASNEVYFIISGIPMRVK